MPKQPENVTFGIFQQAKKKSKWCLYPTADAMAVITIITTSQWDIFKHFRGIAKNSEYSKLFFLMIKDQ